MSDTYKVVKTEDLTIEQLWQAENDEIYYYKPKKVVHSIANKGISFVLIEEDKCE